MKKRPPNPFNGVGGIEPTHEAPFHDLLLSIEPGSEDQGIVFVISTGIEITHKIGVQPRAGRRGDRPSPTSIFKDRKILKEYQSKKYIINRLVNKV